MTAQSRQDSQIQTGLFPDPIGMRLRLAREAAGMTREAAAKQLRLPSAIIDALEKEDWQRLGAQIYVRAHLSAYLRLLDLPADLVDAAVAQKPAPRLAAMASHSRLHGLVERGFRNAVYLVMTAVIVVPVVWLATHYDTRQKLAAAINLEPDALSAPVLPKPARTVPENTTAGSRTAELPTQTPEPVAADGMTGLPTTASAAVDPAESPTTTVAALTAPEQAPPVVASLAPFPRPAAAAEAGIRLIFNQESWLEVVASDGRRLERGLIAAGSERTLPVGEALRVTLGNADAVKVEHSGAVMDLTPYRSANVARFTVSSTSELSPAGQ